jgi:Uma2 family endonuclease
MAIRMARALERPRKTIADYVALGPDCRAELIGGELYVTPSPSPRHQHVTLLLASALHVHALAETGGTVLTAPLDVHLPSGDVVQPDILWVRSASRIAADGIRGVPDLVVEVVSSRHPERDRAVKRVLYERNGVPAFWIADPEERSLEGLAHDGRAYVPAFYAVGEETVAPPSFPGLVLDLRTIFAFPPSL